MFGIPVSDSEDGSPQQESEATCEKGKLASKTACGDTSLFLVCHCSAALEAQPDV